MSDPEPDRLILRGQTLRFIGDPFAVSLERAVSHHEQGAVFIEDGRIRAVGPWLEITRSAGEGVPVVDYGDDLIMAGFVDCHMHYPQISVIASYGAQLLDWLDTYTFPTESKFADPEVALRAANAVLDELARNGTTTASVYCTSHPQSVEAFFEASSARNMRMAAGKVAMDRNAPEALLDSAERAYEESKALIERWHGVDRNLYAITPRFAPTSTEAQLEALGALWAEFPDTLMQTHASENVDEVRWVQELFPDCPDYIGVYERYGLLGRGAIFGHAIHLAPREIEALRESGSAIAHCPTSNTFIGSGLFDMAGLREGDQPLSVGLATDVGGGSSFSMLVTMRTAYKVAQLRGHSLHPAKAFWLATVGSAGAMGLEKQIGNLNPGFEADLVVLDLKSTPLIKRRVEHAIDLWEVLFAQMILGDDRAVRATYSAGAPVYERSETGAG